MLSDVDIHKDMFSSIMSRATLEVFQVHQPVLMIDPEQQVSADKGTSSTSGTSPPTLEPDCELLLMNHSFGNSYGHPFVGM